MRETEKKLLEMKNTSELMLDLAYSALLYYNRDIAEEVVELEEWIDFLYEEIQKAALTRYRETGNFDRALVFMKVADAIERIADAALDIADVVLRDIEIHPVLRQSIQESDTIMLKRPVHKGSFLDGKTLGQVRLASETGMWVVAIKRGREWMYGPDENVCLMGGDMIFTRGPEDSIDTLEKWTSAKPS